MSTPSTLECNAPPMPLGESYHDADDAAFLADGATLLTERQRKALDTTLLRSETLLTEGGYELLAHPSLRPGLYTIKRPEAHLDKQDWRACRGVYRRHRGGHVQLQDVRVLARGKLQAPTGHPKAHRALLQPPGPLADLGGPGHRRPTSLSQRALLSLRAPPLTERNDSHEPLAPPRLCCRRGRISPSPSPAHPQVRQPCLQAHGHQRADLLRGLLATARW